MDKYVVLIVDEDNAHNEHGDGGSEDWGGGGDGEAEDDDDGYDSEDDFDKNDFYSDDAAEGIVRNNYIYTQEAHQYPAKSRYHLCIHSANQQTNH